MNAMSKLFSTQIETIDQPLIDLFVHETPVQRALREVTVQKVEHYRMMTSPEQVRFLQFLLRLINAQWAIEVGVFTGYGSLAIAQALPPQGKLIACDQNEQWPSIGKPYWEQAGVADKIDLHIAPALETLQALLDEGYTDHFDFVFVDADKIHYADYGELAYRLLRNNGLLVFDNIFWIGEQRVVDQNSPATRAVANLLDAFSRDNRYETTLVPMAEGMLLAKKHGYNGDSDA